MISIITLNWSRFNDLTSFWLEDIIRETPYEKEIIIVDQGSTSQDVNALKEAELKYHELKVIYLSFNSGFPEGNNIGARSSIGDYIIFMNNDIRIWGDWWSMILPLMNGKVLVGPSLISEKTGWNSWNYNGHNIHVPYLEGWLLCGQRNILKDIGYFDPIFGTGSVEDVEFCYRSKKAGYSLVQCPQLPLKHLRGATVNDGRLKHFETNKLNLSTFKNIVERDYNFED